MTAITYDYIKNMESAGFTPTQIQVLSAANAETATKVEINRVEKDLTDKIEKSETRLEKRMDERFDLVDKRFTALEQVMNERFAGVEQRFTGIDQRFAGIEKRLDSLSSLLKWLIATAATLIPSMTAWFTWLSHLSIK